MFRGIKETPTPSIFRDLRYRLHAYVFVHFHGAQECSSYSIVYVCYVFMCANVFAVVGCIVSIRCCMLCKTVEWVGGV